MKYLISGLALAAVLAIAAPAGAQTPSTITSSSPPPSGSREWVQPAPGLQEAAAPGGLRLHRRYAHHTGHYHHGWRSSADHMATRLNRQELRGGVGLFSNRRSNYIGANCPQPRYSSAYRKSHRQNDPGLWLPA